MSELTLATMKELVDEIAKRHAAHLLVVAENPDSPEQNLVWWSGTAAEVNWMIEQARHELHRRFPPANAEYGQDA